ncbi:hypothetical protein QCA50_004850 [Cerrena zonata]|uniref:Uncharacterized protein n=1 Tax=Cerrena zonata TaxID=2478898 RepID=A0AAW0GFB6_9APHY
MEVIRVTLAGSCPPLLLPGFKGVGPVHEKSKKVGGHCVSYRNATKCENVTSYRPKAIHIVSHLHSQ